MQQSQCFQTHYGHVFSDHQPQIFVSSVGFLDVVKRGLAFHKVLGMFHILGRCFFVVNVTRVAFHKVLSTFHC